MNGSSLAIGWDDYLVELREDAHQLLAWSYSDTRSRLARAKDEYEMTGLLAEGMDARINSPETAERFMLYSIHNERPTSPKGQLGKKRPKLDIQIGHCGVKPKPYFTFEAKRLRDDANCSASRTMRTYLGADGIMRFISGHYAPESVEAAMLGCIQAHDAEFWFNHVGNAFETDEKSGGALYAAIGKLQHASVIKDFSDERVSIHARSSGVSIQLFHLFIDCR
jgi:hypothetical protein